jgi:hypothetical protein
MVYCGRVSSLRAGIVVHDVFFMQVVTCFENLRGVFALRRRLVLRSYQTNFTFKESR